MKLISFRRRGMFLILFFIPLLLQAQFGSYMHWEDQGSHYFYTIQKHGIVKISMPDKVKETLVDSTELIPQGSANPLPIRDFSFSKDGSILLIYTNTKKVWRRDTRGDYWILNIKTRKLRQLGKGLPTSSLMFAKLSNDSKKVAYVSEHNLYIEDLQTGQRSSLTKDGSNRLINGTFDWAYEEEFDCRDGFRWSPDSKSIAFWQIDARQIRNFLLIDNTDSLYSFVKPVEYPKAGQDPSSCKIGVVDINTKKIAWMNIPGDSRQHYIPRMEWADNSKEIILEQLNRKQQEAKIFVADIHTGTARVIYKENDPNAWIDIKSNWNDAEDNGWDWIDKGKSFLWVSEKDGWRHLYKISRDGSSIQLLTKGKYDLMHYYGTNQTEGFAYFAASPYNATQKYLYKIALDGNSDTIRISDRSEQGTHEYALSPDCKYAYHYFSNLSGKTVVDIENLSEGKTISSLYSEAGEDSPSTPHLFQITTEDGITMDGWMILPKNFDSTKKYPVLFYVYTEPAACTVKDIAGYASCRLYHGDPTADGYILISLDGRGTPAPKGAAWRKAIYRKIGIVNIRDQAMAAKKILQWPFVDTSRIAVWGWSGGGSTTLNLMFQYPEIYKTGIAIAPVANQLLYDNIYQERYMGIPQETHNDYVMGSPISHASGLKGHLLIIHGTGDDNVHYQGTEMLINELIKYGKIFEFMSYPNRTHAINEGVGTSAHLSLIYTDFLHRFCPAGPREKNN